jgi:hypothetical protein
MPPKRTRDDGSHRDPSLEENEDVDGEDFSPRRRRGFISEFSRSMLSVAREMQEMASNLKKDDKEKEKPALEAAIRRRLGTRFPEDLFLLPAMQWVVDPRFVAEPLMWFLAAERDLPLLEMYTVLGSAGRVWLESARTQWILPRMSAGDVEFCESQLRDLEKNFRTAIRTYLRFPATETAEQLLVESFDMEDGPLYRASVNIKELEGKRISTILGPKAARDFYSAWKLQLLGARSGATVKGAIEKIRLRSTEASRGRGGSQQDRGGRGLGRQDFARGRGGRAGQAQGRGRNRGRANSHHNADSIDVDSEEH